MSRVQGARNEVYEALQEEVDGFCEDSYKSKH